MITIRNLKRQVWLFSVPGSAAYLLVGDGSDTDEWMAANKIAVRDQYCPNPVVTLTAEDWAAIGPANRDLVRDLTYNGTFAVKGELGPLERAPTTEWESRLGGEAA